MSGAQVWAGRRILVVDDEPLVGLLIEDLLIDAGAEVIGPATSVEALALVAAEAPDGALLDVNLEGELVYPVADALAGRGTPFAFVTGYSQLGVDPVFTGVAVLPKPLPLTGFAERVAGALGWTALQAARGG